MGYRHIEIGGLSYIGSTTMNFILGSLPGVVAVGESHWLVDNHARSMKKNNIKPVDISKANEHEYRNGFVHCQLCGPECKIYTKGFRDSLVKGEKATWHSKIAKATGARVIVTSDKHPKIIRSLDNDLRNATIVLFKHPYHSWMSYEKRGVSLSSWIGQYVGVYSDFLNRYKNKGPKLFVSWEHFTQKPDRVLLRICEKLHLNYNAGALEYWNIDHHYIGGNYNIYDREKNMLHLKPVTTDKVKCEQFLNKNGHSWLRVIHEDMMKRFNYGL